MSIMKSKEYTNNYKFIDALKANFKREIHKIFIWAENASIPRTFSVNIQFKKSQSVIFLTPFNHCYLLYTPRFKFHPTTHSSHPEGEKGAPSSSDIANPVFFAFHTSLSSIRDFFSTNTFLPHFAFYVFTNFRVKRSPPVLKGYLTLARNGVKLCELSFFAQFPWIFRNKKSTFIFF